MKFKTAQKGFIAQKYGGNADLYASIGVAGHTGVDYVKSYGSLHQCDNTGYVYKVWKPKDRADRWVGVYQLVPYGDDYMEVIMGHFSKVFVEEGETIEEGTFVGAEGNSGLVYTGNTQITPAMQDAGDRRGAHVHEAYRPVRRSKEYRGDKHYLTSRDGKRYVDKEGYLYEIINTDKMNGYVDPMAFAYKDSLVDKLRSIVNAALKINSQI